MVAAMFDLKDIFTKAWEGFSKNAVFFIVLILGVAVIGIFTFLLSFAFAFIPVVGWILSLLIQIIFALVAAYCGFAFVKSALAAYNGDTIDWSILKFDMNAFVKYLIVSIIIGAASFLILSIFYTIPLYLIGAKIWVFMLCSLVVAILIIALITVFFPAFFMIVDKKDVGMIDVFPKTLEITKPQFLNCLVFLIIIVVFNSIAAITILGLFITVPMSCIATAAVYKKLDVTVIQK